VSYQLKTYGEFSKIALNVPISVKILNGSNRVFRATVETDLRKYLYFNFMLYMELMSTALRIFIQNLKDGNDFGKKTQ
jgi:hypothetical protein